MAELTDTQKLRLCSCSVRPGYAADHRNCDQRVEEVAVVVREHVTAALDEIEKRIESASWFTFDDNDVSPDEEFLRRSDVAQIVRGYRQEQDRDSND